MHYRRDGTFAGRGWLFGLGLMVALGAPFAMADAERLTVYVGQGQMPFADYDEQGARGLFGDLMVELCQRMAIECTYRSVPWKRVQVAVNADPHGVVLNLGRVDEREAAFNWLLGVLSTRYVLTSLTERFDSIEQALQAGPVVVMAGTPRATELQAARRPDQHVVEVTDPQTAARMLYSGRVVAWYEISSRSLYLWRALELTDRPLHTGATLGRVNSYIAGSQSLEAADDLRARMQQAFNGMLDDGSWRQILERYLGAARALELIESRPLDRAG